jgi:multidrug efflux pump subunit AcrB
MVGIALWRPYTFIVMAVLILIFGVTSALRTPTDIFPNIDIPVVSVAFSYTGLPPDDMTGRIVTFYERALTTSVNDIEHRIAVDSQLWDHQDLLPADVNINAALAEVSAMSQTVLKQMPAGITPPLILSFNASNVPILQLALSSQQLSETILFGQIIDATIVSAPKQHNSREENEAIKEGETPEDWKSKLAKNRQKDKDARWTKKYERSYFGLQEPDRR